MEQWPFPKSGTQVDEGTVIDFLEELAETLGLRVSYEPIRLDEELGNRPGGFCLLKGEPIIIINPGATPKEKIRILAEAVRHFDLDRIYIRPVLRELLNRVPEQSSFGENGQNTDEKPEINDNGHKNF